MFITNSYLFINFYMPSPLDQFADDCEDILSITTLSLLDKIPGMQYLDELVDLFLINEIYDLGEWIGLLFGSSGLFTFDDEDPDSSEWDEIDGTISSLQSSIFTANITGMIPGVETITSDASLTFLLSISTIVAITLLGLSLHGIRFIALLYPTGTPIVMAPFIILIEFVSYMARAVSLGMRLFANMFAGHSLVKILMSFAWLFINSSTPVIVIPVFILLLAIFIMEAGIAYLQSYVFSALIAMYIEDAISLGH